jgi:hypothetical protein
MVSYNFPTVNVWFKIAPDGTALHSDAFREAANSEKDGRLRLSSARPLRSRPTKC